MERFKEILGNILGTENKVLKLFKDYDQILNEFFQNYKKFENEKIFEKKFFFHKKKKFITFLLRDILKEKNNFFPDFVKFKDFIFFEEIFKFEKKYFLEKKMKFRNEIKNEEFLLIEEFGFFLLIKNLEFEKIIKKKIEKIILYNKNNFLYFIIFLRYNLLLKNDFLILEKKKIEIIFEILFLKFSTKNSEISSFEIYTIISFLIGFKNKKKKKLFFQKNYLQFFIKKKHGKNFLNFY